MFSCSRVLVAFAATLVLLVSPLAASGDVASDEPIDRLIHGFVEKFAIPLGFLTELGIRNIGAEISRQVILLRKVLEQSEG